MFFSLTTLMINFSDKEKFLVLFPQSSSTAAEYRREFSVHVCRWAYTYAYATATQTACG